MSSRKDEERNEKIIRGLMKLPPNRRCINCNSLGPQYVCTNFWTFVCTTCSGIHREFTHRVKSVSMANFTSLEVEALQKGGNQRARETFLKDWNPQRQRMPDSSNADKVREFIKNVYVDRRYVGGKTSDKPPRDMQDLRLREQETRRASSYHSYSQSPPYDYQYEERRYGKQAPALTRKPGSDRGLYEGRFSSFSSPSRFSDQMHEDGFANEGPIPIASDCSVSSAGDPCRSDTQSPNFQSEAGFGSPYQTSGVIVNDHIQHQTTSTFSESNPKIDSEKAPHSQRTGSWGSFGSLDGNSMSLKSVNSVGLVDVASGTEQSADNHPDKQHAVPSVPQSSVSGNFGGLDLFGAPFGSETVISSASTIDLFQLRATSSTPPLDLFQPSAMHSDQNLHAHQSSQLIPSLDLFSKTTQQQPTATTSPDVIPNNEGWANFDLPQNIAPTMGIEDSAPAIIPGGSLGKIDPFESPSASLQWPAFEDINAHERSSVPNLWHEGVNNIQVPHNATSMQSWDVFEDPIGHVLVGSNQKCSEVAQHAPSIAVDQYSVIHEFNVDVIQRAASESIPLPVNESLHAASTIPSMVAPQSHASDHKSTNPFDLPYDSDIEASSMFLDMSSFQAALPSVHIPDAFLDGVTLPWFPQSPVPTCAPDAQQGALGLIGGQAPSSQMQNVPTQGPTVASVGRNPFA